MDSVQTQLYYAYWVLSYSILISQFPSLLRSIELGSTKLNKFLHFKTHQFIQLFQSICLWKYYNVFSTVCSQSMCPYYIFIIYMKRNLSGSSSNNQLTLKTAQQQAFLQIFNLHAINGKITQQGLRDIFYRIGFKISEQNFNDICQKSFGSKQQISFQQFMQTFKVKQSNFDLIDIKNSFKLIAGDSDQKISVKQLEELFLKNNIQQQRINQLFTVLSTYIDKQGMFNFKTFLSHLS